MPLLDPLMTRHPVTGAVRPVTPDLLSEVYLAPRAEPLDIAPLVGAAHWPWTRSHAVAPRETAAAVEAALEALIAAVPGLDPELADPTGLEPGSRAARHLGALGELWRAAGGAVPEALAPVRHALRCEPEHALEPLPVIETAAAPGWTQADRDLAATLRDHHSSVPNEVAAAERARVPGHGPTGSGPLGALQAGLLRGVDARGAPVSLVGLRDALAEADWAAALAQRMLDDGTVDAPEEIALLVPPEGPWLDRLGAAFDRVGVPLSGMPGAAGRDVAGEALRHLLACLRPGRAPSARASLFVSPLMPWDRATGTALARHELGHPGPAADTGARGATLLGHLRAPVESARDLARRLDRVAGLVAPPLDSLCRKLAADLSSVDGPPDWERLLDAARPRAPDRAAPEPTVEGVSVLLADRAPWRGARQLIALGLAGDRYPVAPAVSPLFLDSELDEIARACGISMTRRADRLAERMDLMRRQISVARDGVTALVPRRGLDGRPQAPAPLATLLARALGAADAESALSDPGPAAAAWDVAAVPVSQAPPRPAVPADGRIALGRDLAILRTREDGRPRPQSPSRLETLLVSPLAWLLAEIEALDVTWVAEEPTALARGSVAHGVFERLFAPGAPPGSAAIAAGFDAALAEAIAEEAPFYERADWSVDRGHLAAETRRAAEAWAARLAAMGAEIVEVETRLEGPAHGLALSGKADAILRLADGRMLVVDYKSGRSDRRRTRMQAGWDLQVRLYLDLLGTAGRGADGVGYFCLGDGVLLSSSPVTGADRVSGDISGAALERIAERLGEVRRGIVTLNAEGDAKALSKLGIGAYALDSSPLVAAHLTMEDGA